MLLDPELHYLDNAATTMVDPEIAGAIHEALLKDWANPSSLYEPAVETHEALTTARGQIARTLGCQAKDLYFTSCGSESNNLAVQGLAMARKNWGSKIVVSGFEHPSVQRPIRALKDRGFEVVEILPEADGHLDVAKLAAEVDKNTVLVSCMAVNNETGTLQDIAALSTAVKAKNSRCAVHVDAVQAWLRIPIDLKKWKNVDTLSVSGHKVHAPKGIGALFIRDSVRQTLCPPYLGGHQERGLRPGTENTPYIVGLGLAAARFKFCQKLRKVLGNCKLLLFFIKLNQLAHNAVKRYAAVAHAGIQCFLAVQAERSCHCFKLICLKQHFNIITQALGFFFKHLAPFGDIFFAALFFEPRTDFVARIGRTDNVHPIAARAGGLFGSDNFDDIAVA